MSALSPGVDQARPDAALLVDWDNLKAGLKSLNRQPNVSSLLDAVNQRGRVVVARAYADWQQRINSFDPPNLYAAGIEPVYVPVRMHSGKIVKNSADVKLAVDTIDLLNTASHIQTFFLVSGDSDLIHLINFLRARGKRVVVIAVSHTLAQIVADNLDELLIYDVDIDPIRLPDPVRSTRKKGQDKEIDKFNEKLDEAFGELTDLLRNRSNRVGSLFSWIGIQLGRKGFDHRTIGFERFKDFMQEAERRGKVKVITRGLQDWAYLPEQYEQMTETEAEAQAEEEETEDGAQPAAAVTALADEDQQNFLRYLFELEERSEYLIPPYIVSHLVRDSVLPNLSQSQLRALVRDAMEEQILVPSIFTVPHRQTGKPYDLRTVRVNDEHPLAVGALRSAS
ncbi:MAG: hypothetical protein PVSMB7_29010 [Chloroflexota bacterium]